MVQATNSNRAEKRIIVGARVSGKHGKLVANPNPLIRRRIKEKIWGKVIAAIGKNKYSVRFDDGTIKECSSKSLKTERADAGIPLNELAEDNNNTTGETTSVSVAEDTSTTGETTAVGVTTTAGTGTVSTIDTGDDENGHQHDGK